MTPKDKAIDIYETHYYSDFFDDDTSCKSHSKNTINEIIKVLVELSNAEFTFIHNVEYWQEVRKEIDKL